MLNRFPDKTPEQPRMPITRSKEYREFLKGESAKKEMTIYEKACNISEKIVPIKPWKSLKERYYDAIMFSHLKVSPEGAFSLAVLATMIFVVIPMILAIIFNVFSFSTMLLIGIVAMTVFYSLYGYPFHFATMFRIKASAEMVLAVIYMTISMQVSPNIENAIDFAAKNLSGALSVDLHQLLWDVYLRKHSSAAEGLDNFINKWKRDNKEFAESLYLIKTATIESTERREQVLDEAVSVMLRGTKERMKNYAHELTTPVMAVNALGILLPIIGLVFLPMMGIFMPEAIRPIFIIIGYNIFLPLIVYWMMKTYLDKRPYGFHHPDISKHPKFLAEKKWIPPLVGILLGLPFITIGIWQLSISKDVFSFNQLFFSLMISFGITVCIVAYSMLSVRNKIKIREEIVQMESEFAEVLFQLGHQITRGIPFERTLKNITPQIKNLKISRFFDKILYNIETFGMTLEQAVFDKKMGAIREYPSKTIDAVMHAIVEISKRGIVTASKSMITVSTYLKDSHAVEQDMKDMLGEVTSTMQIQTILLAPLSSGIVVAISAMIMNILVILKEMVGGMYGQFADQGPMGVAEGGILGSIVNLDKMIPVHIFQLIVSIYMIEVVGMLSIFLSTIQNGDEDLMKRLTLGRTLAVSFITYAVIMLVSYTLFVSLIPMSGLG